MFIELRGTALLTSVQDGGCARIVELDADSTEAGTDNCFFIRLQSWDESQKHETLKNLEGKNLYIRIEVT